MPFQSFKLLPDVVKNLLILNGLFFLATIVLNNRFGIDLIDILGLHFPGSEKFHWWQFISYMFMHGGFAHIFFNMFAVWMFGAVLENYWGSIKFIVYYILTGIGAALTHYAVMFYEFFPILNSIDNYILNPSLESLNAFINSEYFTIRNIEMKEQFELFKKSYNELASLGLYDDANNLSIAYLLSYKSDLLNLPVVVGASGALFGILLAYGMLFPNNLIYLYFAIPIKAKYFVILYGVLELYSGLSNNGSNVAHFAHLGGMIFGYILIKLWKKKDYFDPYE
jgi:membrane associated rhomboid family serine protease